MRGIFGTRGGGGAGCAQGDGAGAEALCELFSAFDEASGEGEAWDRFLYEATNTPSSRFYNDASSNFPHPFSRFSTGRAGPVRELAAG